MTKKEYLDSIKERLKPYPEEMEDEVERFINNLGVAILDNPSRLTDERLAIHRKILFKEITPDEGRKELILLAIRNDKNGG